MLATITASYVKTTSIKLINFPGSFFANMFFVANAAKKFLNNTTQFHARAAK